MMHLRPFYLYNVILIIIFSIIVNPSYNLSILHFAFYSIFHFFLIYIAIYHYRNLLYFINFFYGILLDIMWFSEIGPHLIVFISILILLKFFQKQLYSLTSLKMYILIILLHFLMIMFESFLTFILLGYNAEIFSLLKILLLSLFLSYPLFFIFIKIDSLK